MMPYIRKPPDPMNETLSVFVVRALGATYRLQHRKLGSIIVAEGQETYVTAQLAREAGEAALRR